LWQAMEPQPRFLAAQERPISGGTVMPNVQRQVCVGAVGGGGSCAEGVIDVRYVSVVCSHAHQPPLDPDCRSRMTPLKPETQ
jgi:hypothetical protein